MPSLRTGEAKTEIRFQSRIGKKDIARTSATGPTVSTIHLILSRAPSHVFESLIVVMVLEALRRAFLACDIPALPSSAGGIEVVIGESVSKPVIMVDRVDFMESWAIEGPIASPAPTKPRFPG